MVLVILLLFHFLFFCSCFRYCVTIGPLSFNVCYAYYYYCFFCFDSFSGTNIQLNTPKSLCYDPTRHALYVSVYNPQQIRKIDVATRRSSNIGNPTGTAGYTDGIGTQVRGSLNVFTFLYHYIV